MQLQQLTDTAAAPKWNTIRAAATQAFEDIRRGYKPRKIHRQLLTPPGANTKLAKGSVPIYGLTLAPAGASGYQLCPWRSSECEAACLGITSGRSRFSNVQQARIQKTRLLMENPVAFFHQLHMELRQAVRKHGPGGFAFRSNVLADIAWEGIAPDIYRYTYRNYDYTKSFDRALSSLRWPHPLRLTLSFSGHNVVDCVSYLRYGGNAAFVFGPPVGRFHDPKHYELPDHHLGFPVIDGDQSDARWLDPAGCIVGLRAKGRINLASPFVVRL
jgi:hypothetical protein